MICLERIKKKHDGLMQAMSVHYSAPKGFVGRSICYAVKYAGTCYGYIVGGSATLHLPGRNEFFGQVQLNNLVNNIFFHIEPNGGYPARNFATAVVSEWRRLTEIDWREKYGDSVVGFETLVELPRSGELYRRDGWTEVGVTKGYTCKRTAGKGTDSWSGRRVWNTDVLRPKRVFVRMASRNLAVAA